MIDVQRLEALRLLNAYPRRGLVIRRGNGVFLEDDRGEKFLDMMSNYGVSILGHNHPVIIEAVTGQFRTLPSLHGGFSCEIRTRAAAALAERCGGGLNKVFFANSGAEANEAALKFAALAAGRKKFIAFRGGFHGKTLGALSATDGAAYRAPFEPLLWDFRFLPYGRTEALEEIDAGTAGVIVEPIQGESGVRIPPAGFLAAVRRACSAAGAVLIVDEIQTGMGRTGRFLASAEDVAKPDIVTLGKGLAGGIPVGAVLMSDDIAAEIPRKMHTSTFGGNPPAAAGIIAVLSVLTGEMLDRVDRLGRTFVEGLRRVASEDVAEIRGKGLMIGVEIRGDRDAVLRRLQQAHVLAIPAGSGVIRFLPPYIINEDHVETALAAFQTALSASAPRPVPVSAGSSPCAAS